MNSKKPIKGILLGSGGIDSTVLMYKLARENKLVEVCFSDYGQASRKRQIELLKYHTNKCGVPLNILKIPYPKGLLRDEIGKSGFIPNRQDINPKTIANMRAGEGKKYLFDEFIYLEGRNTFFFLFTAARATLIGANIIYTAFQYDKPQWKKEKDMWGDNCPFYIRTLNELFYDGFVAELKVKAPFLEKKIEKKQIADMGRRLGIDLNMTYSCEFFPACGRCIGCSQAKRVGANQSPRSDQL